MLIYDQLIGLDYKDPTVWEPWERNVIDDDWQQETDEFGIACVDLESIGVELQFKKTISSFVLRTIWLTHNRYVGTKAARSFSGKLPSGIKFDEHMQKVISVLGQPDVINNTKKHPLFGTINANISYKKDGIQSRFEFDNLGLNSVCYSHMDKPE